MRHTGSAGVDAMTKEVLDATKHYGCMVDGIYICPQQTLR
jgi:hypothetical protein